MQLNNWIVVPARFGLKRLRGDVSRSPNFSDGEDILTSPIVAYKSGVVTTQSGSKYRLGKPSAELFNVLNELEESMDQRLDRCQQQINNILDAFEAKLIGG